MTDYVIINDFRKSVETTFFEKLKVKVIIKTEWSCTKDMDIR